MVLRDHKELWLVLAACLIAVAALAYTDRTTLRVICALNRFGGQMDF